MLDIDSDFMITLAKIKNMTFFEKIFLTSDFCKNFPLYKNIEDGQNYGQYIQYTLYQDLKESVVIICLTLFLLELEVKKLSLFLLEGAMLELALKLCHLKE